MSRPLVSIVIVSLNGADLLDRCLKSVFLQSYRPIEVIVVDNGSTDASLEMVSTKYPEVHLVVSLENRGFAEGNNNGIRASHGEYIALLNNDAVVEENWLDPLVSLLRRPEVGVVCSKVVTEGVPPEFYEMNGTVNFLGYNVMRVFRNLSEVFFAGGASLLFRRRDFQLPFLDEYFLYHEDVYLSWRARMLGFDVVMAQESVVRHRGSVTTRTQPSDVITFYQERNRFLNCLLLYEAKTLIILLPYFIGDLLAKLLLSLLLRRKSFLGIFRAYAWIARNQRWITVERGKIQSARKVPDREIMRFMSPCVLDADNVIARLCNTCSAAYARITGLHYHE